MPRWGFVVPVGIAIAVNTLLAWIANDLRLPLYLDSVLTFAVVALFGAWAGIATAVGTNSLLAVLGVCPFPFVVCHLLTVLGCWLLFRGGRLSWARFLSAGLMSAVSNGLVGNLIAIVLYHGVTSLSMADFGLALALSGQSFMDSVFWAGILINGLDKLLSATMMFFLVQGFRPKSRAHRNKS